MWIILDVFFICVLKIIIVVDFGFYGSLYGRRMDLRIFEIFFFFEIVGFVQGDSRRFIKLVVLYVAFEEFKLEFEYFFTVKIFFFFLDS